MSLWDGSDAGSQERRNNRRRNRDKWVDHNVVPLPAMRQKQVLLQKQVF